MNGTDADKSSGCTALKILQGQGTRKQQAFFSWAFQNDKKLGPHLGV
jgi:hypothetical protein